MDQSNPFEDLFHQINDLLQIIADKADKPLKGPIPKDIEAKLSKLERQVEDFRRAGKAYIAQLGVTEEDMKAYIEKVGENAARGSKRIYERTEKLKEQIEQKKAFIEKQPKSETKVEAPVEDISISEKKHLEKKSPTTRKNLFKRIGGNTKWRPL